MNLFNADFYFSRFIVIDNIEFDDTYVIIKQKPIDSICECNDSCLNIKYKSNKDLPTYAMCKEAMKHYTQYKYWILEKSKDII